MKLRPMADNIVLKQSEAVETTTSGIILATTKEKPAIEVVGVVWPERRKNNKVYRYDPNGEQFSEGDMVLVPTRSCYLLSSTH